MKLKIVSDPELIVADDGIKRTLFESRESCVSNKREIGLWFQVTEEALMGCVPGSVPSQHTKTMKIRKLVKRFFRARRKPPKTISPEEKERQQNKPITIRTVEHFWGYRDR